MLENINFTDPQGVSHAAAVIAVRRADKQTNQSDVISLDVNDNTSYIIDTSSSFPYINYEACYWSSSTVKANGAASYPLLNTENMTTSFFFVLDESYNGLTLLEQVEKHLTDVVLPPMLNV